MKLHYKSHNTDKNVINMR